jgi:hypothetical protein
MQHRILTVDDDSEARLAVQAILERQQMLVTLAESAEDGLAALSGAHFDLVEALVAKSNLQSLLCLSQSPPLHCLKPNVNISRHRWRYPAQRTACAMSRAIGRLYCLIADKWFKRG